jgi:hypothetical protein
MPFFMTVNFRVMTPAISIAPQKEISPSPSAINQHLVSEEGKVILTGKVQITNTELGTFYEHRQIDLAASGKILDVTISTVLWPAWDCSCALFAHLLLDVSRCTSSMYTLRLRGLRDDAFEGSGVDEIGFSVVPGGKDLVGRSTTKNARMDQTGEADARNVSRGAEDAFEVPDCLCTGTNSQP